MAKFHLIAQIFVIIVCLAPKFLCNSTTDAPEAAEPIGSGKPEGKPISNGCKPTDYPFLVEINHECVGSLIERNIVLTTARCVLDAKKVKSMSQTSEVSDVDRNKIHESFNTNQSFMGLNNIGLIKLTTPLNGGLVKVSEADAVKTCIPLKVAGTGIKCFDLTYVEGDFCATRNNQGSKFVDLEFCGTPQLDGITGFRGAPVICDNAVLGLAQKLYLADPTPYVKVYSYLQFIENTKKELMAPPGQPKENSSSGPKNDSVATTEAEADPLGGAVSEKSRSSAPYSANNNVWMQSLNWNLFYAILTLLVNFL